MPWECEIGNNVEDYNAEHHFVPDLYVNSTVYKYTIDLLPTHR